MKREKRSAALLLLAVLGALLVCAGCWNIRRAPRLLQYAAVAPGDAEGLMNLVEDRKTALSDMADAVEASVVTAVKTGASVSAAEGEASALATLLAGGEGLFAVYPRYLSEGRLLSETELKHGEALAVLDEDLAFALFASNSALDQKISVGGTQLRVVGVVRHSRRVGEGDLYSLYAPVGAVAAAGFETVALTVLPVPGSGAEIMFPSTAEANWFSGGTVWVLEKEAMRALLPLRVCAGLAGIAVLALLLRLWNRFSAGRVASVRRRLEKEYFPRVLPMATGWGLLMLLGYAALAAGIYLLASFIVAPLYTFTEWVPDNLVKWSSIRAVFWNLVEADSRLVTAATAEARALSFWGGVTRWGVLLLCAAGLLSALRRVALEKLDR